MKELWLSLKLSLDRNYAIKKATQDERPEVIFEFLQTHPSEEDKLVDKAINLIAIAPWRSLLLCVGLVIADSTQALMILKELIKEDFPGWKKLNKKYIQILFNYIQEKNNEKIFNRLIKLLDTTDLALSAPNLKNSNFLDWLNIYITNNIPLDNIIIQLIDYIELLHLKDQQMSHEQISLRNVHEASIILWNHNYIEESLEILSVLTILCPELITKKMLEKVSKNLPYLIPRKTKKKIIIPGFDYLTQYINSGTDNYIPFIPYGVTRSVNILRRFPSSDWVPSLKESWLLIDGFTRISSDGYQKRTVSVDLAAAANALAIALGVCSACDESNISLDGGKDNIKHLESELEKKLHLRNNFIKYHNSFVERYKSVKGSDKDIFREIERKILANKNKISDLDEKIELIHNKIKSSLSPGTLLLITLNDIQAYAAEIRQGAAWGLFKLIKIGYLNKADKNKINEAIRCAVFDNSYLNSELRERLNRNLPEKEELSEQEFNVILDYLYDPCQSCMDKIKQTLIAYQNNVKGNIISEVENVFHRNFSYDFRERQIYLLPEYSLLEFEQNIYDGLTWLDLIEKYPSRNKYNNIDWIIKLLCEHVPGIFEFLCKYPFRLMTLDQHKQILGKYSREKCGITLWTRYTPPIWKRGIKPDEVGIVKARYLSLEDRSKPNSMGIYYRLFEHPILALPIIYHEYLHYGGPTGDPQKGILNESDVLIREVLFMKYLIAKLAPKDDYKIPEYEHSLVLAIQNIGLNGLGMQINFDIENDNVLSYLCDNIEKIYGIQLDIYKTKQKIDHLIKNENRNIRLINHTEEMKLNWYPEIEWPELKTEKTHKLTEEYSKVLQHSFTINHRIDSKQRDKILEDKTCQKFLSAWNVYKKRPNAQKEFQKAWPIAKLKHEEILAYIVNRYFN